jgi:flagellar biosynthesis/type III secretory pathway protein FliH
MSSSERTFRLADWTVMAAAAAGGRASFTPGAVPRATAAPFRGWEPGPATAAADPAGDAASATEPDADAPGTAAAQADGDPTESSDALADPASATDAAPGVGVQPDLAALEAVRGLGFEEGLAAGRAQGHAAGRAEALMELTQERELLRRIGTALEDFSSDPHARFEPLKRLALHVAQELVRCELSLSPHAIDHLVRACVAALDAPGSTAVVSLSPADYQMMASDPARSTGLTLECDERLSQGSVQVRADDARVLDFIEHRLESLAGALLLHARPGTEP